MDKYKEFENITLNDLGNMFSAIVVDLLNIMGITNLSQLFQLFDSGILGLKIPDIHYNHVYVGIKLLKCKYLDEDPLIDENNENINDICCKLGLPPRASHSLMRYKRIYPDFNLFEFVRRPDALYQLGRIRNIGEVSAKEIYERGLIVVNYHDKHKDDNKDIIDENNEKETLEYLYAELKRLREENARIDKEIGIILGKIEEKTISDSKGGINK